MKQNKKTNDNVAMKEEINAALWNDLYRYKYELEFLGSYIAKQKLQLKIIEYLFIASNILSALAIIKKLSNPIWLAYFILITETLKILKPKLLNFNISNKEEDLKQYRSHTSKLDLIVLHFRSKNIDSKEALKRLTTLKKEREQFSKFIIYDKIPEQYNRKLRRKAQEIALEHLTEKFRINGKKQ